MHRHTATVTPMAIKYSENTACGGASAAGAGGSVEPLYPVGLGPSGYG